MTKQTASTATASIPRAYALLIATMVIWASAFAGLRRVLKETDALSMTAARMLIAAIPLAALALYWRVSLPRGRDLAATVGAGLCGFTIYHLALNFGLGGVGAGSASLIIATAPLWTALLAWKLLGERLGPRGWAGLALSFAGVVYLSAGGGGGAELGGAALVLCAALCAAANTILQKSLFARHDPLRIGVLSGLAGCAPFALILPWRTGELSALSAVAWWTLVYLGVGPIAVGYLLYAAALKTLPASRSAQMLLMVPPLAALIAWIWLDEAPSERIWLAGALVIAGVWLGRARRPLSSR